MSAARPVTVAWRVLGPVPLANVPRAWLRPLTLAAEGDGGAPSDLLAVVERCEDPVGTPVWLLYDADGPLVGWACVFRPLRRLDPAWWMTGVYVRPDRRQRGGGLALARAARAWPRANRGEGLYARAHSEAGRRLYARADIPVLEGGLDPGQPPAPSAPAPPRCPAVGDAVDFGGDADPPTEPCARCGGSGEVAVFPHHCGVGCCSERCPDCRGDGVLCVLPNGARTDACGRVVLVGAAATTTTERRS